jgi:hypothetical protein
VTGGAVDAPIRDCWNSRRPHGFGLRFDEGAFSEREAGCWANPGAAGLRAAIDSPTVTVTTTVSATATTATATAAAAVRAAAAASASEFCDRLASRQVDVH